METVLIDNWQMNQNTKLRLFWREFWTVLFLSVIPLVLASFIGGQELLLEIVKSLVVPEFLLFYMLIGTALYILIALFKHYILLFSRMGESLRDSLSTILRDVAISFLGIFRIAAGLFFAVPLIWVIHDFDLTDSEQMAFIAVMGVIAFGAAISIHWLIDYFKPR